jgi:citrate synthase
MYFGYMERMLSSEEAALRLGVKVTTLYAYVSRGLLASHPESGGRRSLFDLADVERLAIRQRGGRQVESRLATITTGVTQLRPDGPCYRGRRATELARALTFEGVAALLWQVDEEGDWRPPEIGAGDCTLVDTSDRMRWALVMCGAGDPLRADLRPAAVTRAARRVIAALTDVVGTTPGPWGHVESGSIARQLALRLAGGAGVGGVGLSATAVDAALVLLADHELATSTVAVRLAASTRADLYDALLAGLATMAGPLHGGASQRAYELLAAAERDGTARALNEALRWQTLLPGFGHTIYTERDPRFEALWELAEPLLSDERRRLFLEVIDMAAANDVPPPNCDLALAALSWGTGMASDAGRTIFTIARVAGWTAHYLEELAERPLRFRARAVYSVSTDPGA